MSKIIAGIVAAFAAAAVTAGMIAYAGLFDVAADTPHAAATFRLIAFVRERSIARRVEGILPPDDLGDPVRLRRGAGNYAAMCLDCHLAPGVEDSELRRGLYPQPPNLSKADDESSHAYGGAARRFWIIKHGIKASGMPAWSKGGMDDETIWDLVAFVQRMPTITGEEYRELVRDSSGHSHAGMQSAPGHSSDERDAAHSRDPTRGSDDHRHAQ